MFEKVSVVVTKDPLPTKSIQILIPPVQHSVFNDVNEVHSLQHGHTNHYEYLYTIPHHCNDIAVGVCSSFHALFMKHPPSPFSFPHVSGIIKRKSLEEKKRVHSQIQPLKSEAFFQNSPFQHCSQSRN